MIEKLRQDLLQARKDRNTDKTNLLSTIVGEVTTIAKSEANRAVTENDVTAILKKFLKGVNETIDALQKAGRDTGKALFEKEILESYLPKQLSEEQLTKIIEEIMETIGDKSPKAMGQIMSKLKEQYDGQYDGKLASAVVKKSLS